MLTVIVHIPARRAGVAAPAGFMTASAGLDTATARDRCGASSSCGGNAMDLSRCAVPSLCHTTVLVIANRSGQRVFIKPRRRKCNELLRV